MQPARACAAGDYDNDDYPDLLITTTSDTILYHNNKGQFVPTLNQLARNSRRCRFR